MKVYAAYYDNKIRSESSSGGVFSLIATKFEVIYGVAMTEDCYSAEFKRVMAGEDLSPLRCSKYLQAKVGNTFSQVKEDLETGKSVLFTGTGCQVNGLKTFLGRDYEKLVCIDVICHGAPSPALWRKYAKYQEEKNEGKLKYINFRCKDVNWNDFGMKELLNNKRIYIPKDKDPYMQMFLSDFCLRPSCYECVAKNVKMSDLTIADFWGIDNVAPDMNDGNGTSLVLVRTKKGKDIFEKISGDLKLKEVTYEEGIKCNPAEYKSCKRPNQRETFFDDMNVMNFEELKKKYIIPIKTPFWKRVARKIKSHIKSALQIFVGGQKGNKEYGLLFLFHI